MKKKVIFLFFMICFAFSPAFSLSKDIYASQQLIHSGHWVYDAIYYLSLESKQAPLADISPITVGELKMHFSQVKYEKLSESGKQLYRKVQDFFDKRKYKVDFSPVFFAFNIFASPQASFKSNKDIDWTFGTDYTGHLNGGDNEKIDTASGIVDKSVSNDFKKYAAGSAFLSSLAATPFLSIPLYLGFSDYIMIETEPFIGSSYFGMTSSNLFSKNLPTSADDFEFLWPRNAYGSAGMTFENFGFGIHCAKQGLQIGRTMTGSIIYNDTFETDFYGQISLYSPNLKYNMDVVEIDHNKFMYLHTAQFRPFWKWLKCSVVEGTLINGPFEIRYLNPLMIMHSFGSWTEYSSKDEEKYYGEAHVCAYMGINVEMVPVKNLRIYFYYAQNEIQPSNELGSENGRSMPDSLGGQLGYELTFPDKKGGWWKNGLEAIYTTPYLYVKQGADWSLFRQRYNMQSSSSVPLCSWIGTPFGPDAIGVQAKIGYERPSKWNAELDYLFLAHGTSSFGMFGNTVTIDGVTYYAYYPSVRYKMGQNNIGSSYDYSAKEAEDDARSYNLKGTIQYTNQITLKGKYNFNDHISLDSYLTYSFIFNNKNKSGDFEHGLEMSVAWTYSLF